ncbi:hypothetical protein BB558_000091 [Smittium angustum]|uniref:Uncharacterized protein n=1 Tax=Smittium angustum TaxID=133377 RepID=A0A2U1JF77_SMIAN|nr:hypothetical protein BB558_000091 [Smittium angustum]
MNHYNSEPIKTEIIKDNNRYENTNYYSFASNKIATKTFIEAEAVGSSTVGEKIFDMLGLDTNLGPKTDTNVDAINGADVPSLETDTSISIDTEIPSTIMISLDQTEFLPDTQTNSVTKTSTSKFISATGTISSAEIAQSIQTTILSTPMPTSKERSPIKYKTVPEAIIYPSSEENVYQKYPTKTVQPLYGYNNQKNVYQAY